MVEVPASGRGDGGIGTRGGGDIRPPPPYKYVPIYFDSSDTGDMPGGGISDGSTDILEVVGAVRN